jgi:site-specific DNA-methyltransferase (adenine-specific)
VEKAYREAQKGALVVMLLPARTDTKAFHRYILPYAEIRFIEGRLRFENEGKPGDSAPFPSMVVIFKPKENDTWMQ